jgi:hypothetical protein
MSTSDDSSNGTPTSLDMEKASTAPATPPPEPPGPEPINYKVLAMSKMPFYVALASFVGLLMLIAAQILVWFLHGRATLLNNDPNTTNGSLVLANYLPHLFLFLTGIGSYYIAFRLIAASGVDTRRVISGRDANIVGPAVATGNVAAINQYVRLSGLSGFTGIFTKFGWGGLSLATIALTLIFSGLSLISDSFLDLAKLTLGAFIGSFVQRQVEGRAQQPEDTSGPST